VSRGNQKIKIIQITKIERENTTRTDKGITNKEHPKNELHNIAKRIREKNPNPIPFKD
jgi:hypothetical protein